MSGHWVAANKAVGAAPADSSADLESGTESGLPNFSAIQHASSFSTFEGRSYRFQNVIAESRTRPEGFHPSSYSANPDDIRDNTAELGDLAIHSDDGSLSAFSHLEQGASAPGKQREFGSPQSALRGRSARKSESPAETAEEEDADTPRLERHASADQGYFASAPLEAQRNEEDTSLLPPGAGATEINYGALDDLQGNVEIEEHNRAVAGDAALEAVSTQWNNLRKKMRSMADAARSSHDPRTMLRKASELSWSDAQRIGMEPVRQLPAVVLGLLLNILDGVSYGMITFPTSNSIFSNFGGDGVSMFFMTCVIAQLVYTLGGSIFKGGNGSMMIEVVPFYHILVQVIIKEVGEENPQSVIATTMVAFALSSFLTGLMFLLLGTFRLGVIISYFPRHILVGCIGGVGVFLIETGLSVAARIEDEAGFKYDARTLATLTQNAKVLSQWTIPLTLACLLCYITSRVHHPLILPVYFMMIPVIFYVVASGLCGFSLQVLRETGWVFDVGSAANAPFYRYFSYFDLRETSFQALWATLPSQLALVFFGILHVPLNVPALGVSVGEDNVDTDRELIAHGVSNMASGMMGTVPNYLCYVNSVLFYRVGGGSRLSGLMLAGATVLVMLLGPGIIGYLPVMVVAALIFVLGIDLVREALYDTVGRVNRLEYLTIAVIVVVMTWSDFVVGSLVGMVLACLFFVMQTSRRNAVRSVFNGNSARSTVRRHAAQRRFLDEAGRQTVICKLEGALFFGTINSVEQLIRKMLDIATWKHNPIRFLVMDFTQISTIDFSAAEAMTRIHRMLSTKSVLLVLCGLKADSDVAKALQNVDLWTDLSMHLEVFASLNEALEWTENEYLRSMYTSGLSAGHALGQVSLSDSAALGMPARKPALQLDDTVNSPRYEHLHEAAKTVTQALRTRREASPVETRSRSRESHPERSVHSRAYGLLVATLGLYTHDPDFDSVYKRAANELKELHLVDGTVLWERGEMPDACTSRG